MCDIRHTWLTYVTLGQCVTYATVTWQCYRHPHKFQVWHPRQPPPIPKMACCGLHEPSGHYVGPMGPPVLVLSPNDYPNQSQEQRKGFRGTFPKFQVPLYNVNNSNFGAFGGAHGLGYMGPVASTWVPWVLKYPSTSIVTKRSPKPIPGRQKGFKKNQITKVFRCHSLKTSKFGAASRPIAVASRA